MGGAHGVERRRSVMSFTAVDMPTASTLGHHSLTQTSPSLSRYTRTCRQFQPAMREFDRWGVPAGAYPPDRYTFVGNRAML